MTNEIRRARLIERLAATPAEGKWWAGYLRRVRRRMYGKRYGSAAEHRRARNPAARGRSAESVLARHARTLTGRIGSKHALPHPGISRPSPPGRGAALLTLAWQTGQETLTVTLCGRKRRTP
jgi:hypothetical protein